MSLIVRGALRDMAKQKNCIVAKFVVDPNHKNTIANRDKSGLRNQFEKCSPVQFCERLHSGYNKDLIY